VGTTGPAKLQNIQHTTRKKSRNGFIDTDWSELNTYEGLNYQGCEG